MCSLLFPIENDQLYDGLGASKATACEAQPPVQY